MQNETVTNIFWGLFFIWLGMISVLQGSVEGALDDQFFALGTGVMLLILNLVRSFLRLRIGVITLGLGVIVTFFYAPIVFFRIPPPSFLPLMLVILGIALIIGALKTRTYL
ncbi:MAG: hypothetical protein HY296_00545 [Thaumarchaeota archaeon]|nr:hypothetical protein [Nitrososphaerota archaeon]